MRSEIHIFKKEEMEKFLKDYPLHTVSFEQSTHVANMKDGEWRMMATLNIFGLNKDQVAVLDMFSDIYGTCVWRRYATLSRKGKVVVRKTYKD
jgi:hypothetical protein